MYLVPLIIGFSLIPYHYGLLHVVVILFVSGSKPQYKASHQQKPAASGDATPNRPQQKQKPFQHQANGQQAKKRPAPQTQSAATPAKKKKQGGKPAAQQPQQPR